MKKQTTTKKKGHGFTREFFNLKPAVLQSVRATGKPATVKEKLKAAADRRKLAEKKRAEKQRERLTGK